MKFKLVTPVKTALFLCLTCLPVSAFAADPNQILTNAIQDATNNTYSHTKILEADKREAITEVGKSIARASVDQMDVSLKLQRESSIDYRLMTIFNAVPLAMTKTAENVNTLMKLQFNYLNGVPFAVDPNSAVNKYKPDFVPDSSLPTPVSVLLTDIDRRYFCDPNASGGRLEGSALQQTNVDYRGTKISYTLGCGKVTGASIETRESLAGAGNENTAEGKQIIGLPTRPGDLFFNITTFPVSPSVKDTGATASTNTNPLSKAYIGAYMLALNYLVGQPSDSKDPLAAKERSTKQLLASYPFAVLFADRIGTLGPEAAKNLSTLLVKSLGGQALSNSAMVTRLRNLSKRHNISMAEYKDIMMYQIPTSQNYYDFIVKEKNPNVLIREDVRLSSLQTALDYERNRWMEIEAALEAAE